MARKNVIKDTADILQVGKEEAYTFIEKLLCSAKNPSPLIGYTWEWMKLCNWDLEIT